MERSDWRKDGRNSNVLLIKYPPFLSTERNNYLVLRALNRFLGIAVGWCF